MTGKPNTTEPDVVLVGAGIMSTTLGVLLKEVEPTLTIVPGHEEEDYTLTVPTEAAHGAGDGGQVVELGVGTQQLHHVPRRRLGVAGTECGDECLYDTDIGHVSSVGSDRLRAASSGDSLNRL